MRLKTKSATLAILASLYLVPPCYSADNYILINKSKKEAYLIKDNIIRKKFPVGIGRKDYETPSGKFRVINKAKNPSWNPDPESKWLSKKEKDYIKKYGSVPHESPLNPLGDYWIGLLSEDGTRIGIHDVDHDEGIGKPSSHGCIRVKTKNLKSIIEKIPLGTEVRIINR